MVSFDMGSNFIFHCFLMFCRISPVIMFMPGSSYLPSPIKLIFSIALSVLVSETISINIVNNSYIMTSIIECAIGIFIALIIHFLYLTFSVTGNIFNMASGVSSSMLFDNTIHTSDPVMSKFLSLVFATFFFASNMHFIIFESLINSYATLNFETFTNVQDFSQYITQVIGRVFEISFKIATPLLLVSFILYLSIGVINKLIPNIQVFFIFMPLHVWLSFLMMFLCLGGIILWFSQEFMTIIDELISVVH